MNRYERRKIAMQRAHNCLAVAAALLLVALLILVKCLGVEPSVLAVAPSPA